MSDLGFMGLVLAVATTLVILTILPVLRHVADDEPSDFEVAQTILKNSYLGPLQSQMYRQTELLYSILPPANTDWECEYCKTWHPKDEINCVNCGAGRRRPRNRAFTRVVHAELDKHDYTMKTLRNRSLY